MVRRAVLVEHALVRALREEAGSRAAGERDSSSRRSCSEEAVSQSRFDLKVENLASQQLAEILKQIDGVLYEAPRSGVIKLTHVGSHTLYDGSCSVVAPKETQR